MCVYIYIYIYTLNKKTHLLREPLSCSPAAETPILPLPWRSETGYTLTNNKEENNRSHSRSPRPSKRADNIQCVFFSGGMTFSQTPVPRPPPRPRGGGGVQRLSPQL